MPLSPATLTRTEIVGRLLALKQAIDARRARSQKYSPDQPRDEAGRWTDLGGSIADLRFPDNGFTYSVITHSMPIVGYAVSLHKEREAKIPAATIDYPALVEYVVKNADLLNQEGNWLGTWHNPDDGMVYLDVSTVLYSPSDAEVQGRAHQQLSYYDISKKKVVPI